MKTAIYARVSTQDQNLENQLNPLIDYCERQGWEYEVYKEKESTRKTRPVKAELLQKLRKLEYDCVLIYKLDRWARSTQELALEVTELFNKGVKFISLSDNIDLTTASGQLQFSILSAFAQFERDLIRERVIAGLARKKAAGMKLGRPKGAKDTKRRRKSGYYARYANK